jgi:DNA-binding response OmpR family regulator
MAEKILIVEDERNIASFVSMYLKNARYQVEIARDGGEALMKAENTKPDLVVLDLMLPDIDGLEVCRQIRSTSDVPILMLTARDDDIDKIVGLEVGADDYLTKPFNPRELVARIKSILRRATQTQKSGRPPEAVMEHGAIKIDAGRREVTVSGDQVQLAPKEFDLLWELLDHRGRPRIHQGRHQEQRLAGHPLDARQRPQPQPVAALADGRQVVLDRSLIPRPARRLR